MKKQVIKTAAVQTRIANLVVTKVNNAVSFFGEAPVAEISEICSCSAYKTIVVKNEYSHMLTFAEIDTIREAIDPIIKKYQGCGYTMQTMPYISKDNSTTLHMPVIEITIRRYEKDELSYYI